MTLVVSFSSLALSEQCVHSIRTMMSAKRKSCIWCKAKDIQLVDKKPYCLDCQQLMQRECVRCHRPYPDVLAYFEEESHTRCKPCHAAYAKEKLRKATVTGGSTVATALPTNSGGTFEYRQGWIPIWFENCPTCTCKIEKNDQ